MPEDNLQESILPSHYMVPELEPKSPGLVASTLIIQALWSVLYQVLISTRNFLCVNCSLLCNIALIYYKCIVFLHGMEILCYTLFVLFIL